MKQIFFFLEHFSGMYDRSKMFRDHLLYCSRMIDLLSFFTICLNFQQFVKPLGRCYEIRIPDHSNIYFNVFNNTYLTVDITQITWTIVGVS